MRLCTTIAYLASSLEPHAPPIVWRFAEINHYVGLRSDTNIPCRDHLWPLPGLLIINIHFKQCYACYYPYFTCRWHGHTPKWPPHVNRLRAPGVTRLRFNGYGSRRSRIFLRRGPLSCEVPSRRDSVGGGGSSSNFRSSPEAVAIQWGGGSSRIFPWSPNADAIQSVGGGVVAEFLRDLRKPARFQWGRGSTIHFPLMGPFYIFGIFKRGPPFLIFGIFKRGDPLLHFLDFQKGGARAPGPPGPPPWIGHCMVQPMMLQCSCFECFLITFDTLLWFK